MNDAKLVIPRKSNRTLAFRSGQNIKSPNESLQISTNDLSRQMSEVPVTGFHSIRPVASIGNYLHLNTTDTGHSQ